MNSRPLLPLAQKALEHITQFEKQVSPDQFNAACEAVKDFSADLSGFGFYAIQAKVKLQLICTLDLSGFVETTKQLQTEPF
jgi:hypothetical protein